MKSMEEKDDVVLDEAVACENVLVDEAIRSKYITLAVYLNFEYQGIRTRPYV